MNHVAAVLTLALLPACASQAPASPRPAAPTTASLSPSPAPAEAHPAAAPSSETDPYARLVVSAEAGDEAVDFLALRAAYLESPALERGMLARDRVSDLRKSMFAAMGARDYATVLDKARQTLSLVYVDLEAQKARYQSCAALKDEACAARGKRIEQSLLRSVVSSGDGLSCAKAWNAITIDEEYFVLRMLDAKFSKQTVVHEGARVCDAMDVTDEAGKPRTYYFDIGAMMKALDRVVSARPATGG